jgi:transcriptional regulator MraZ
MSLNPENGSFEETTHCFHGSYERAVDVKGRFNLPFRFRKGGGPAVDEHYVVSTGPMNSLSLFPRDEWTKAFIRAKKKSSDPKWQAQVRQMSADSLDLVPDAQGRVAVSTDFLERAGIDRRVLVVGMGHYMELWNPETLRSGQEALAEPDQEFRDEFFF